MPRLSYNGSGILLHHPLLSQSLFSPSASSCHSYYNQMTQKYIVHSLYIHTVWLWWALKNKIPHSPCVPEDKALGLAPVWGMLGCIEELALWRPLFAAALLAIRELTLVPAAGWLLVAFPLAADLDPTKPWLGEWVALLADLDVGGEGVVTAVMTLVFSSGLESGGDTEAGGLTAGWRDCVAGLGEVAATLFIVTRVIGGELPAAIEVFRLLRRACCRSACLPVEPG